jgi:hypothetical protein
MLELKCVCGGYLFFMGDGEYCCNKCERIWSPCWLCSGSIHTRNPETDELELEPISTSESVGKILIA